MIGGSLGGLNAALALRDCGCEVDVLERTRQPLMGQGLGIVAHPSTMRYLVENDLIDLRRSTVLAPWVRYVDRRDETIHQMPSGFRFTSYFGLYEALLGAFDEESYHLDSRVVSFEQSDEAVAVQLADGSTRSCELLVCADGINSESRRRLLPGVERKYAGYVAWRGAVGESELSSKSFDALHQAITYMLMPNSHILAYPIPNVEGSLEPGSRYINWIWYWNAADGAALDSLMTDRDGARREISIPPGSAAAPKVEALRERAEAVLSPSIAEMVTKTSNPFVQAIFDLETPRLAFDRACLLGDAACVLRPHVAVGTAKAAEGAWRLGRSMRENDLDPLRALRAWEGPQLQLELNALDRTRAAGDRSQFENSWRVGEPLPFGLYESGDSAMPEADGAQQEIQA